MSVAVVGDLDGVAEGNDPGVTLLSAMRLSGLLLGSRRSGRVQKGGFYGNREKRRPRKGLQRRERKATDRSARWSASFEARIEPSGTGQEHSRRGRRR